VNTADFQPLDRATCRADFGLDETDLVVATGCASLTDTNKDTPSLLQILAEMNEPRLRVLVFGDGQIPCPPNLRVSWLGPQRDKQNLARIYSAADVFASASRMETYGLTFAEALCCGTPVVGYGVGGVPEAVGQSLDSRLVAPYDVVAFGQSISELIRRGKTGDDQRKAIAREVAARTGAEIAAEKILGIYHS
jgi:glycosyltransferase involved in cell wall biosynthesis